MLFQHLARVWEALERIRPTVRQAATGVVVVRQQQQGVSWSVVLRDGAHVTVQHAGHLAGDLGQQGRQLMAAAQGDGGADHGVQLAFAGQAGSQVIAVADGAGELVDIFGRDATVAAGRTGARQKAGGGPAADGHRGHTEAASGSLNADVHRLRA